GIGKIDGIFVSHSDFDHIYGIIEVIKEIPTEFIVLSEAYVDDTDALTKELLDIAKEKGIAIYYFRNGFSLHEGALVIECVYPKAEALFYKDNNGKSLVLKLSYKDFTALLMGDLEKEQEAELCDNSSIHADLVKVPHHGSKTSSSDLFVSSVAPKVAVLSYGLHNQFGHPSAAVVSRYRENNCEDIHIALEGAVIVTTKGKNFQVEGYLSKRKEIYSCSN
ncbi:MAG: hypothetical protein H7X94_08630, partial [Vallitaleaceae bacterium]|nr:hypothetical protein [Vallitaleaceae bacterium]